MMKCRFLSVDILAPRRVKKLKRSRRWSVNPQLERLPTILNRDSQRSGDERVRSSIDDCPIFRRQLAAMGFRALRQPCPGAHLVGKHDTFASQALSSGVTASEQTGTWDCWHCKRWSLCRVSRDRYQFCKMPRFRFRVGEVSHILRNLMGRVYFTLEFPAQISRRSYSR